MSSGSLIVLKGIQCNNLYYLKGSAVTKNLAASEYLDDDSIRLRQMSLRHVGMTSLQALAKQGLLEGALTCYLKFGERCVVDNKTKVKFSTVMHRLEGL